MIAYEGKDPYIFVSYSHVDTDKVVPIISKLKQRMCRVWYDEGLFPGESWNDSIADHLKNCEVFLIFISESSVKSKYVFTELNYALSKDKKIIPIKLDNVDMPSGIEMMLSAIQILDIAAVAELDEAVRLIALTLPTSVFSTTSTPFLEDLGHSFFLISRDVERADTNRINACSVIAKMPDGEECEIFSLKRLGAYETDYKISSVDVMRDYFYTGKIRGSYQINIKGQYNLEYPLYGPDVDVLLICILRIPRHGAPTMRLVDYQYVDSVSSYSKQDEEELDVVGEKGWSCQIKKYLEEKLYS